jgi:phage terminase large subunit-like protein
MSEQNFNLDALHYAISSSPEERKYILEKDFSLWFCYYYIDYIKFPFAPFHYEMFNDISKLVDGTFRELAWVMFRESAKTSIAKGFITYLIATNKRKYINVDSFDKENAERMLFDAILELQKNPRILKDYGELYNVRRNTEELTQKKISNFLTNNGIRVEAHSTQESIRGRLHGSQRPDALILDDFETNKTKDSEAYTAQVAGHISEAQSGMDAGGIVLYLCNYITEYGNVSHLFERSLTDLRLKVRRVDVLLPDGTPSWPQKYTLTDEPNKVSIPDIKKKLGPQVFDAEMMNNPIDETSQEFISAWFKYIQRSEVLLKNVRKFALIDSAMSKKSDSDNTGISRVYVDKENKWYVSAKKYRVNVKSLIDLLFQLHDEGMEKIGIEETAYTEGVKPYFEEECRKRNKYPYIVALKHGGVQKETRIRSLIPRYSNGDIFHITDECVDLESELLRFPRSKHDDVMDSLAYAPQICEKAYDNNNDSYVEELTPTYGDIGI